MKENTLSRSFIEKQCYSIAFDLIEAVVELKSYTNGEKDILQNPHVNGLLRKLQDKTNMLVDTQGGL